MVVISRPVHRMASYIGYTVIHGIRYKQKIRRQVASLAAWPFRITELYMYMHVTIMHLPIANR